MTDYDKLKRLGFSQYEITCYLTLAAHHPVNGSRLSRLSGVARSRVYDVLRNLERKGFVLAVDDNQYVPLPPDELFKRLEHRFNEGLQSLKDHLSNAAPEAGYEYIWTIRGYDQVMAKAIEMISHARQEIYVRLFPDTGKRLTPHLKKADERGVGIRFISMGPTERRFKIQLAHPAGPDLIAAMGGLSFDLIVDRAEALVGVFEAGQADTSPINWSRNRWFVTANRDSLRHDVYHCLLDKILEQGQSLTDEEEHIYHLIKKDN